MTKLNSSVTSADFIPNLFGPIGQKDDMELFFSEWKARPVKGNNKVIVVGRKDGQKGCFSLIRLSDGRYDVAHYDETPKEIWSGLSTGMKFDAGYFQTDPRNKYVAMDLIAYLKRIGEWKGS